MAKETPAEVAADLAGEIEKIIGRLGNPPTPDELATVQRLIDAGADLERRFNSGNQDTLLMIALSREYTDAALLLIRNGADINIRCIQNITPFIWAAMKGNAAVLQAMYDTGKTPPPERDAYDSIGIDKTALVTAAQGGHLEAALLLIRNGADIYHQNNDGQCALDYAKSEELAAAMKAAFAQQEGLRAQAQAQNGAAAPVKLLKPLAFKSGAGR